MTSQLTALPVQVHSEPICAATPTSTSVAGFPPSALLAKPIPAQFVPSQLIRIKGAPAERGFSKASCVFSELHEASPIWKSPFASHPPIPQKPVGLLDELGRKNLCE